MKKFPIYFQIISILLLFMTAFGPAIAMAGEPNSSPIIQSPAEEGQSDILESESKRIRESVISRYHTEITAIMNKFDDILKKTRELNSRENSSQELQPAVQKELKWV